MAMTDGDHCGGLDHLHMLYPELVDRAMRSEEPITDIKWDADHRTVYTALQYDPAEQVVWRADIDTIDDRDQYDSIPQVNFSKCYPTASEDWMQGWTDIATGRLNGPHSVSAWSSLFTVFNAAHRFYLKETGKIEVGR